MALDSIRLSEQAREQLVKLKRHTRVTQWNILSRWALCTSLAEPTVPPDTKPPADSSVEMSWKVFAGADGPIYLALLRQRCHNDGIPLTETNLAKYLRLHLHRGIGYLAADRDLRSIGGLLRRLDARDGAADE